MFRKIYRLSDEGNRSLLKAGLYTALFNLAAMLPLVPLAMIENEMIRRYFKIEEGPVPLWGYSVLSLVLLVVIFYAYRVTYREKYLTSGNEDMMLRMGLADKIRKLPLSYIGRRDLSDLTSTIMDDVAVVESALAMGVSDFIGGLIGGIVAIMILFFYNPKLAFALAVCLPLSVAAMALCRAVSEGTNKRNKQKKLDISQGLQEYLENIKVLKTSEKMESYQRTLEGKVKKVLPGLILYEFLSGSVVNLAYNIMRIGLGLVIVSGSSLLLSGEIGLFTFLIFLFAAVRVYEPLMKACIMLGTLIFSLVSAKRVGDLLDYPEQRGEEIQPTKFDICFDNVSFAYNQEDVLKDVSFTAKQGQITALVGPSGCGKSTVCRLAARFWDVGKGRVSLGGIDLNEMAPDALLKNYSFVFQDVVLFNDTIYNNIRIGKEEATKEEVIAAAKLACCDEFIERLPRGYETVIGENGKTLSGGERQRISIARAFLKDAPVILLDESTASIDPENETKIQQAIAKLIENKTVLIIAHKLRSIVECDKIVVLKEGRVEEEGTHEELMHKQGLYHRLYSLQDTSMQWKVGISS